MTAVAVVALLIFLVNLPFGFWRAKLRRLSPAWLVAVHAPVPVAIGLRFAAGLGWRWQTLPIFVGAYVAGQLVGGRLRSRWRGAEAGSTAEASAEHESAP